MNPKLSALFMQLAWMVSASVFTLAAEKGQDFSPPADERQVARKMHSAMKELPRISVGHSHADIIGTDNRALQAAVDYVVGLGGGIVEIGEGEYLMRDSLHLHSLVTVRGTKGKTILRKAKGYTSPLAIDGDYGEEQITVLDPTGFGVGCGVAVWDSNAGGFHTTVARITGSNGNIFSIDKPLNADCMVHDKAKAATLFPVISGYNIEGARVENLAIDGNKEENQPLNGCRGGGIFLYRGFNCVIQDCAVRNFNGDGISFQQSNDVTVFNCVSEDNTSLGIHPGSGSQRATVRGCLARRNGDDGLFLCWRVRHGLFEDNILEDNGRFGISIGHKDTDNLIRNNQVRSNYQAGIYFRDEAAGMAGHRNRVEQNLIENNGVKKEAPGVHVRGETKDIVLKNNTIRDTRLGDARKQTVGIQIEEKVGNVLLEANTLEGKTTIDDRRKSP
jgi:parallel beta-helix repeat protein